jgi:hypothetical protein
MFSSDSVRNLVLRLLDDLLSLIKFVRVLKDVDKLTTHKIVTINAPARATEVLIMPMVNV